VEEQQQFKAHTPSPLFPIFTKAKNIASNNDQHLDSHILIFCYGHKNYENGNEKQI
jgi:hypothetical protein